MSNRFRARRHTLLLSLIEFMPRPVRVLDIGGTMGYWLYHDRPVGATITLLNLRPQEVPAGFESLVGDACDLSQFGDSEFDLVFSNSVIEHVGALDRQQQMADEVRRVGRAYFVQTPARSFPLEPHFHMPYFQYWPMPLRLWTVKILRPGPASRYANALDECRRIRLLSAREMQQLFPGATIWHERLGSFTKSYVAHTMKPAPL